MYTYYIYYEYLHYRVWEDCRIVINLNREIESLEDIQFISQQLEYKHGAIDLKFNSFNWLKKSVDAPVFSLDKDWTE